MKIINGNILDVKHGVIIHQVNCKRVMGAGLALQIRRRYPEHYTDFIVKEPKLGDIVVTYVNSNLYIIGVYGQEGYGRTGIYTDYEALRAGLAKVGQFADKKNLPVYLPYGIGCGLAGGSWGQVSKIIESTLPNCILVKK